MNTDARKFFEDVQRNISSADPGTEDIPSSLKELVDRHTSAMEEAMKQRVHSEYFEFGPLTELLKQEEVSEILVNGPGEVFVERAGKISSHNDSFYSDVTYRNAVHRLCQAAGTSLTWEHPFSSGAFEGFRVQVVGPPVAKNFQISIRRHPVKRWTLDRLEELCFMTKEQTAELRKLIEQRKNILVAGVTGSGKTSLISAMLAETPDEERIAILEDAAELNPPNSASIRLLTRFDAHGVLPPIDLSDLLRAALRLRPDRLCLGEVRGTEAKDLLMALSTGHRGSMGSLHAASSQEAIYRLEMLVQLGAPTWGLEAVRRLIQLSLDRIIVVDRKPSGERILKSIHRIASLESFGLLLEQTH